MESIRLVAVMPCEYGGRRYPPGTSFEVTDRQHAILLTTIKKAKYANDVPSNWAQALAVTPAADDPTAAPRRRPYRRRDLTAEETPE